MNTIVVNRATVTAAQAAAEIVSLARRHGVTYEETELDQLGNAITLLAGDDVTLDEPAKLLLALRRAGHITSSQATDLHGSYLRAKYE